MALNGAKDINEGIIRGMPRTTKGIRSTKKVRGMPQPTSRRDPKERMKRKLH